MSILFLKSVQQVSPSTRQARHHRTDGRCNDLGDLAIIEAVNVAQDDRRRQETHYAVDECQLDDEDDGGRQINQIQQPMPSLDPLVARGKFEAEMQKQRREKQARTQIRPEYGPVKRVEFSRKVKRVKNKGRQANQIEVQGMGSARPLQ